MCRRWSKSSKDENKNAERPKSANWLNLLEFQVILSHRILTKKNFLKTFIDSSFHRRRNCVIFFQFIQKAWIRSFHFIFIVVFHQSKMTHTDIVLFESKKIAFILCVSLSSSLIRIANLVFPTSIVIWLAKTREQNVISIKINNSSFFFWIKENVRNECSIHCVCCVWSYGLKY